MEKKCLHHLCPVCQEMVYGLRITRIYCDDSCKATHHKYTRLQIESRVEVEMENLRDYVKLFSRNLYLIESVMGPEYNSLSVNLGEFKSHKFQLTECSYKLKDENGKVTYYLSNYKYWMEGEILHVKRVSASPPYYDCVVGRWLYSYPDLGSREKYSVEELAVWKNRILNNGFVWRE